MTRSTYSDMPYDKCNVDYIVDSLGYYEPDTLVTVWFQGKKYYVEEIDCFGARPELIIGKEVE